MAAITLNLDETASTMIEGWVREGHYASVDEAIAAGIVLVHEQVEAAGWTPSASDIAAVKEGQADIAAGRVYSADEIFDPLIARYTAMSARP